MANLALKYRPKTFSDVTEQQNVVTILEAMCKQPELNNRNFLLIGPRGCGKANTLSTEILTPGGYVKMGNIQLGQEVFTHTGQIGKVVGIYPQGVQPTYRITLQDRTYIDVSDQHLNMVYRHNHNTSTGTYKREDFTLTTLELIEMFKKQNDSSGKLRIDIPVLDWEYHKVPVDPYLLGALIGDGSLHGNLGFSNSEADVVEKVSNILKRDFNWFLKKIDGENVDYSISRNSEISVKYIFEFRGSIFYGCSSLQDHLVKLEYPRFDSMSLVKMGQGLDCKNIYKDFPELRGSISVRVNENYCSKAELDPFISTLEELDLRKKSVDKHIPAQYLFNSRAVRLKVLQGLFDTDGYTDKSGSTVFSTSSKQLSDDFAFLVRSLGIRDTIFIEQTPHYFNSSGEKTYSNNPHYSHYLKIPEGLEYCTSQKHMSRYVKHQSDPLRIIESIEYLGEHECQCIMVDHLDHSYICNSGMIPTHNTTLGRLVANEINDHIGSPIEIDGASHSGVDTVRSVVQQAQQYPIGTKYKVFIIDECHALSGAAWASMLKVLEEQPAKSVFILLTTNPEKIPDTIISRVQVFQLSNISLQGIQNRLIHVIEQENAENRGITYDEDAISYIARLAKGGMRDALTLLDKALVYSNELTATNLKYALNIPEYDDYFELLTAYTKKDNARIMKTLDNVYNSGINFVKWFEGFQSFVINLAKYVFVQDINQTMIPSYYLDRVKDYKVAHAQICLSLSQVLVELIAKISRTEYMEEVAISYLCQRR